MAQASSFLAGRAGRRRLIGARVHVIGNSATGKSTLARRLALALDADFVELDALHWLPDRVGLNETDPDELERRFAHATCGEAWVAAGSNARFGQRTFWPRLDTVVWPDLPVPLLVWRVLRRSWQRWRTNGEELLWGTNVERFWPPGWASPRPRPRPGASWRSAGRRHRPNGLGTRSGVERTCHVIASGI